MEIAGWWWSTIEPAGAALVAAIDSLRTADAAEDIRWKRCPVAKPDGWTKSELVSQASDAAGSFSPSTFDNIRKAANVKPSERGGKGQQRRFSRAELGNLIAAIEDGNFRNKTDIAESWRQLLAQ